MESPRPLAIWIHGGGWRMGSKETWVNPLFLATRGYVVASLQYRLSQAATFPAQIEDCKAAVRFLRQNAAAYNLDPKRFAGVGESAGGYLVSMLGVTAGKKVWDGPETSSVDDEVQAVIDLFGPSDLTDITQGGGEEKPNTAPFFVHHMMGCTPTERPDLYRLASPVTHISAKTPPFLILHGEGDPLVPVAQSHILYDALQKGGVPSELIIVPVKYHAGPGFWTKEMQERMIAFLQRSLQLPAQP
ncbi:MAG TPA: alpha/beta hydrolase [Candidatus Methylacidiphilales bacterium]